MADMLPLSLMILAVSLIALNIQYLYRARTEGVPRWSYALSVFTIVFMAIVVVALLVRVYLPSAS